MSGSVAAMLRNQHPSGAFAASPDFAQYRYCWLRDGSFTAYALDLAGEAEASARFHAWCARALAGVAPAIEEAIARRRAGLAPDVARMPPARFSLGGAPLADDWPNFQLDGYGTWLWALRWHLAGKADAALPAAWGASVSAVAGMLAWRKFLYFSGTTPTRKAKTQERRPIHERATAAIN